MSEFKPLDTQRAIRDDNELSKIDKPFLWAAVLRTDNKTRTVRSSLELLAKDTGFHANTAYKVFGSENKPVMRYFEEPKRSGRSVQLRWLSVTADSLTTTPEGDSQEVGAESMSLTPTREGHLEDIWAEAQNRPPHGKGTQYIREGDSVPAACGPSAPVCSISANTPFLFRPSSFPSGLDGDGEKTSPGLPFLEATSDNGPAAETEPAKACDLHTSYLADECPYCAKPKPVSKAPEWKQQQWFENSQRQNEAHGLDGFPVEGVEIARLSDVRKTRRNG